MNNPTQCFFLYHMLIILGRIGKTVTVFNMPINIYVHFLGLESSHHFFILNSCSASYACFDLWGFLKHQISSFKFCLNVTTGKMSINQHDDTDIPTPLRQRAETYCLDFEKDPLMMMKVFEIAAIIAV